MIYRGVLVTGTDTGAGKTVIACGLAALFRRQGMTVGALKPVETGFEKWEGSDAGRLAEAAGISATDLNGDCHRLRMIVPWTFQAPLAPAEAAAREGLELSVDRVFHAMDRWTELADIVVVETAGGVMVPLNPRFTSLDLIQGLELPAVIVAPNRLGVINHALLTVEALRRRDVGVAAVILNQLATAPDPSASSNAALIARHGQVPVYEIPRLPEPTPDSAADALAPYLPALMADLQRDWERVVRRYVTRR